MLGSNPSAEPVGYTDKAGFCPAFFFISLHTLPKRERNETILTLKK